MHEAAALEVKHGQNGLEEEEDTVSFFVWRQPQASTQGMGQSFQGKDP